MTRALARLIQIRPGEERLALLGSAFFLLIQAAQVFAVNAGDTLLFARFGVEVLPRLFIVLGLATLVTTTGYAAVLGRPNRERVSLRILAGLAAAGVVGWGLTFRADEALYPALWLGISLINAVIGTLIWVLVGDVCDARQAKRLFALFASAGILGSVLAGFLTGPLAHILGSQGLLLVFGLLVLVGAAVGTLLVGDHARPRARTAPVSSPLADLREAQRIVSSNPTMRLTAFSAVTFSVLFFSVSYPFNVQVARAYPDETQLAGFLGTFGGIVTALTFLVSLFAASRVYARIGVIGALLLLPLVYLAGFVLWTVRLDLITAATFRFAQLVLIGGLAGTAFSALFNVVPADHRAQVRAFQSAVPAQTGVILSGVLLLLGQRGLTTPQMLAIGLATSVVCLLLVWRMRRTYAASLVQALRQGLTEVFTTTATPFQAIRQDAQSRSVALRGLRDSRPTIRVLAVRLLAELEADDTVDPIAALRQDADSEVRRAAVEALGRVPGEGARHAAAAFLTDTNETVRAAAVSASGVLGEALERAAKDPAPVVRARAAVGLARRGDLARARLIVENLLTDASTEAQRAGLEVWVDVEGPQAAPRLIAALQQGPQAVRLQAAHALSRSSSKEAQDALAACLDDVDARVRRAAAQSLRELEASEALLPILDSGSSRAQDGVIDVLAGRPGAARQALLAWVEARIAEAHQLRAWADALGSTGETSSASGLHFFLVLAEDRLERRILHGLGGSGSPEVIKTIGRGLRSTDRHLRSQALEALESMGERRVSRGMIQLLEAAPVASRPEEALALLSRYPRPWFRALALRAWAERDSGERDSVAELAEGDPDPIVQQSLGKRDPRVSGEVAMETDQTLGIVERVLFLRQVPIFRRLEAEDLEPIARLARERLYLSGESLCVEGDPGEELFVLVEGMVEVSKQSGDARHILRTLQTGDHLGELAILREQPRSASVRALSETRALVLRGDALRSILEDRPEVGLAMLESLAERLSTVA